ncbi:hypothetical protein BACI9J_60726 [Bacillus altitudinis]|nr:hypothetical protein BACI9J_60726 [Bacillus altitudinis]
MLVQHLTIKKIANAAVFRFSSFWLNTHHLYLNKLNNATKKLSNFQRLRFGISRHKMTNCSVKHLNEKFDFLS